MIIAVGRGTVGVNVVDQVDRTVLRTYANYGHIVGISDGRILPVTNVFVRKLNMHPLRPRLIPATGEHQVSLVHTAFVPGNELEATGHIDAITMGRNPTAELVSHSLIARKVKAVFGNGGGFQQLDTEGRLGAKSGGLVYAEHSRSTGAEKEQ